MEEGFSRRLRAISPPEGELERVFGLGRVLETVLGVEAPPVRCGRYLLQEKLGSGGMGTVYRALDPRLRRSVALKLLHDAAEDGADLLRRESRALARLTHPNVVQVFDVGMDEDRTWLAMELIDGGSLAHWAVAHPPGTAARTRRALELIEGAGRGLAAAHQAGIIHRDFKPANVLVTQQGVARVVDFGLARPHPSGTELPSESTTLPSIRAVGSTDPGSGVETAVAGTPVYMAPEQFDAGGATVHSDQYAFCVSAWEVLFGELPFDAEEQVRRLWSGEGAVLRPTPAVPCPRRIVAALRKGLSSDPFRRHASMDALLESFRARRGRRTFASVTGLGVLAGWGVMQYSAEPRSCEQYARAEAEHVWNAQRRTRVEGAVRSSPLPHAEGSWAQIEGTIEAVVDAWTDARLEACRSEPRSDGVEVDSTMICLRSTMARVDALLHRLESADAAALERGAELLEELPAPSSCLSSAGASRPALSKSAAAAFAEARTALGLGDYGRAELLAEELLAALDPREREQARGDALALLAEARAPDPRLDWQGPAEEAFWIAKRAADRQRGLERALLLALVSSNRRASLEARRWLRHARAEYERGADEPGWQARIDWIECNIERAEGRLEQALQVCNRALSTLDRHDVDDADALRSEVRNGKAVILRSAGRHREAYEILEDELERASKRFHSLHPTLAMLTRNLGAFCVDLGEHERALELMERSLEIYRAAYGPEHADVAQALVNVSIVAHLAERPERARDAIAEAIDVHERAGMEVGVPLLATLARIQRELGELEEARAHLERALAIEASTLQPDHPDRAITHGGMVEVLIRQGAWVQARIHAREALRIARLAHNDDIESWTLLQLARIFEGEGATEDAISAYQTAEAFSSARPEQRDDHEIAVEALRRLAPKQ